MRFLRVQWVLKSPYKSFLASLSVLIGPNVSLWFLMGAYVSLCVRMESNGSFWALEVLIRLYGV